MAASIARAIRSDVPVCAGWRVTTTGHPAASAGAVSPPATENAGGKIDLPKHRNRANGALDRATGGAGHRLAVTQGRVTVHVKPATAKDTGRKQAQLGNGATTLGQQTRLGKRSSRWRRRRSQGL